MALGKFALQGSDTYQTSTADKAVDGNTSDAASSGACAHTTNSPYSWWMVDLGHPYLLTGIKIYTMERGGELLLSFMFICRNPLHTLLKSLCVGDL